MHIKIYISRCENNEMKSSRIITIIIIMIIAIITHIHTYYLIWIASMQIRSPVGNAPEQNILLWPVKTIDEIIIAMK